MFAGELKKTNFSQMKEIFEDLKIIELASVLAGPAVGTFFSELGAKVIKIESQQGDVTRSWKHKNENKETKVSAYFSSVNYKKEYQILNLKLKEDQEKVYELIKDADIVITNYKFGDDKKLGVDYETLKKIKPNLIYGSISGYGENNSRSAYDAVLQAETGFMSMTGTEESLPLKMPIALIDILAAHQLKEGLLIGLLHHFKLGKGCKINVSLYDAALASLTNQAANWLMLNEMAQRAGSLHPNISPYGETFLTKDNRYFLLAVGSDKQFQHLCDLCEIPEIANDIRFSTNPERVKNRLELDKILSQPFLKNTAQEWNELFLKAGIPGGIVRTINEVFEDKDSKELILEENIDGILTRRVKGNVFKIDFE